MKISGTPIIWVFYTQLERLFFWSFGMNGVMFGDSVNTFPLKDLLHARYEHCLSTTEPTKLYVHHAKTQVSLRRKLDYRNKESMFDDTWYNDLSWVTSYPLFINILHENNIYCNQAVKYSAFVHKTGILQSG